jgi:hypothetical protein
MGKVYRGRDPVLDRPVALKTVSPELLAKADTMARFQREARAAARLQHPNIVTIYELGEVDGSLFIAMELLEGMDLAQAMHPPGRLSVADKLRVVVDVCSGLEYAHKRGVVHRDVKPANVRVLTGGGVKIVDFGIAHLTDSTMTQTGLVLGTPSYMAPEILSGGRVDHRADMWAVGVVLYELATFGEPPATNTALLSPAADLLATAGSDGAIRIWDLRSRIRLQTLRTPLHRRTGHDALALSLAFSPDGGLLASGHVDGGVHLWHMASGEEYPVKLRHDAHVAAVAFSPDGRTLASGGMDSTLKLWDVLGACNGDPRREMHRQPSGVTAVCYAAGGSLIVTGHVNRILRVLDARSGRLAATLRGPEAVVTLVCLAPDGRHLAVASQDRTIRVFDVETREQIRLLQGHRKPATSLAFFGDGLHLATVALDNAVQLWDLEAQSALAALWGPTQDSFGGVALFGEGDQIAVALADGRIRVWGV